MATSYDNYPAGTYAGDPRAPWNDEGPVCPRCAESVEYEWEFCPWCGLHFDWDQYREEE